MMSRQNQEGGDSSNNYQAKEMIINMSGIDEKRAREVYQEMSLKLKEDFAQEALKVANSRVSEFESILLPKMEKIDGAFEAFTDPSFQILLSEAQKTAASTERPADYDLLSELLVHRFAKGENRIVRAGVNRAVEIVDEISDDALLGLTAFHTVNTFFPSTGDIYQGLDVLDGLFGNIFYGKLPTGRDWLDHLDILDAVRLNSFGGLIRLDEYYSKELYGYVDVGIRKNSEDFARAIDIIKDNKLSQNILVDHALNSEFVRVPISNRRQIESLTFTQQFFHQGVFIPNSVALTEGQKEAINRIYDLYSQDSNIKSENIRIFMEKWDERANLNILKKWWNNLDLGIQVTSVGRVLAQSNAQRCNKDLPSLD